MIIASENVVRTAVLIAARIATNPLRVYIGQTEMNVQPFVPLYPNTLAKHFQILSVLFLLIFAFNIRAQTTVVRGAANEPAWGKGTILLGDSTELRGLIGYNDMTGVVSFENGSDSRSFIARNISGFKYYDDGGARQRVFYALDYPDPSGATSRMFFELMHQYKNFALLSKIDPLKISGKVVSVANAVTQNETLYFLTKDGTIVRYLRIAYTARSRNLYDRSATRARIIDNQIMKTILGKRFDEINAYAKDNKLAFDRKEDLLKILEYFDSFN